MRISELLSKKGVDLFGKPASKEETIKHLVNLMDETGNISDKEIFRLAVMNREDEGTTGIGEGVAIPHGRSKVVKNAGLAAMVVREGADFDSLDGEPAFLFFLIAVPEVANDLHLEVLSKLSTILMDEKFRAKLIQASDVETFLKLIDEKEQEKFGSAQAAADDKQKRKYQLLAVTACPTGIAHTYMAAESLENKAKEMGITIKVETNGSGGVKNQLTAEEIKNADGIIIAADTNVETDRFNGKPVIQTKVAKGIHNPKELIEEALSGNVPIFHSASVAGEVKQQSGEKEGVGRKIYKDLMNGVSHMLPFVIGGGILIALAFLFDDYSINPANFGMNTPFAAFLKTVGGTAFAFMLPVLAGYIAMSIGDRPALAVGFVGGMLANTGGSGFLGALLAGFAAGYLVLGLKKVFSKLPNSLEGIKPVLLYPFFGILLIGALIIFVINPPVAALNNWMTFMLNSMGSSSKVVLGIVLGGMMAVDMGGPVNKAAYVFGTASLASGQFDIMAAVMVGGMVPPLGIALCTTFFKNRFTKKEREAGGANYIMGLSFITEGAIPFASEDPIRVIPSCIIGSATAGGLSMFFGCTLMAPHGGIFVFPVVGNPIGYVIALLVGSIVAMILLAILKKPKNKEVMEAIED
ncbi:PTS fructose transporter subunit IIC [Acetobacterium paludosum]|uniref:PTS fructose transporter subunit IIC n=1 Tax=Acetobacterium paludosum TaxID=52693 RepID=A0A923KXH6_9FIRM|nr:fructose-specific PTS transporter subunit EIIC [Acetobacterium paludosum]MBC3889353.1 PTS fructose transporter subunit IIC [Acetobacterium paludosum]